MVTTKATKVLALLLVAVTVIGITGVALAQSFAQMNGYGHFSDSDTSPAGNFGQGMGHGNGMMHDQNMHDDMMNGYWQDNRSMPDSFPGFVDSDGDGICDFAGQHHEPIDIDGDGIPDNTGRGHGNSQCDEFIDEDGDGICDSAVHYHEFVDEDGDGICDNEGQHHEPVDADGDGTPDNPRFGRGMCGDS